MRFRAVPVLLVAAAFLACDPGSNSSGSSSGTVPQPANAFVASAPFSTTLPDDPHITRPPNNTTNCAPPSNVDVSRSIAGTVTASLGDIGPTATLADGVRDVGATVPDGVYTWSNRPLNADCFPSGPAPAGPFTATFAFSYRAEVAHENQPEVCIFKSNVAFSSFTVTGIQPVDAAIEARAKEEAHKAVDREMADRMSRFVRAGRALPASADARCTDWSAL